MCETGLNLSTLHRIKQDFGYDLCYITNKLLSLSLSYKSGFMSEKDFNLVLTCFYICSVSVSIGFRGAFFNET